MARISTVARHPKLSEIVTLIQSNTPSEQIVLQMVPPISKSAIDRYRLKMKPSHLALPINYVSPTSVSKGYCEAGLVDIIKTATQGKQKDLAVARAALMDIARLNGYIAPTRSESLNVNLHAMQSGQLAEALAAALHALPDSERKVLLASEPAINAECSEVEP